MSEPPYDEFERHVHDKKIDKLRKILAPLKLSDESFEEAHEWILSNSTSRGLQNTLDTAAKEILHMVPTAEQVKECAQIANAASILAEHFGTTRKLGPSMHELSITYREVLSADGNMAAVDWSTFAKRILSDASLLKRVASETSERLKLKKRRTGAPPKTQRDMLVAEWIELLKLHARVEMDVIHKNAIKAWSLYFKSIDQIHSVHQLKKAIAAGRAEKRKKVQQIS